MSNLLRDLVKQRVTYQGALSPSFLHPVSVRLNPDLIPEIDLLARYLGYRSRSQFLRELIETSVEEMTPALAREVAKDPELSDQFKAEFEATIPIHS